MNTPLFPHSHLILTGCADTRGPVKPNFNVYGWPHELDCAALLEPATPDGRSILSTEARLKTKLEELRTRIRYNSAAIVKLTGRGYATDYPHVVKMRRTLEHQEYRAEELEDRIAELPAVLANRQLQYDALQQQRIQDAHRFHQHLADTASSHRQTTRAIMCLLVKQGINQGLAEEVYVKILGNLSPDEAAPVAHKVDPIFLKRVCIRYTYRLRQPQHNRIKGVEDAFGSDDEDQ